MENNNNSEQLTTAGELLKTCFINSLKLFSNILKKIIKNTNQNEIKKLQKFLIILDILKNIESIINSLTTLDKNLIEIYLIIRKRKINQKNIEIIILKSLIIIPSIQIKLTVFLNTLIDIIKEDISSFLYSDLIIIKKILKALNKSYKKLIDTNFKEIDKIRKH
ncbi:MAG: hypothetical protein ACP5RD_07425 [bacterium]|jgi:hypothetical protein